MSKHFSCVIPTVPKIPLGTWIHCSVVVAPIFIEEFL